MLNGVRRMADTRQCVFWSLEKACSIKKGPDWELPLPTLEQLGTLQSCSAEMNKETPEIVDGIWVTSKYLGRDSQGKTVYLPSSGIKIDEISDQHGGWENVRSACASCPANVVSPTTLSNGQNQLPANSKPQPVVGGCFGKLEVMYPGSGSLDELLWKTIERRGLESTLRDAFQLTDPLWYGFWTESPLDSKQCKTLLELLSHSLPLLWSKDPMIPRRSRSMATFSLLFPILIRPIHTVRSMPLFFVHWKPRANISFPFTFTCRHRGIPISATIRFLRTARVARRQPMFLGGRTSDQPTTNVEFVVINSILLKLTHVNLTNGTTRQTPWKSNWVRRMTIL